jgi:hypothetical protein
MLQQSERNRGVFIDSTSVETHRALHSMTAHILRYGSELATITSVVSELIQQHDDLAHQTNQQAHEKDQVHRALKQQLAEVDTIARTQNELAKKLKNTLALVSPFHLPTCITSLSPLLRKQLYHSVQADHDKQQISNGDDLREILRINRGDAVNTYQLAKLTRDDGIAMKSIAVMTMAFLPATSIAVSWPLCIIVFQSADKNVKY